LWIVAVVLRSDRSATYKTMGICLICRAHLAGSHPRCGIFPGDHYTPICSNGDIAIERVSRILDTTPPVNVDPGKIQRIAAIYSVLFLSVKQTKAPTDWRRQLSQVKSAWAYVLKRSLDIGCAVPRSKHVFVASLDCHCKGQLVVMFALGDDASRLRRAQLGRAAEFAKTSLRPPGGRRTPEITYLTWTADNLLFGLALSPLSHKAA
jgi:hypothetical protein